MDSKVIVLLIFMLFALIIAYFVGQGQIDITSMFSRMVKHKALDTNVEVYEIVQPPAHSYWNFYWNGDYYWTYVVIKSTVELDSAPIQTSFPLIEPPSIVQQGQDSDGWYYYRVVLKTKKLNEFESFSTTGNKPQTVTIYPEIVDVSGKEKVEITSVLIKDQVVLQAILLPAMSMPLFNELSKAMAIYIQNTGDDFVYQNLDVTVDGQAYPVLGVYVNGQEAQPGDVIKSGDIIGVVLDIDGKKAVDFNDKTITVDFNNGQLRDEKKVSVAVAGADGSAQFQMLGAIYSFNPQVDFVEVNYKDMDSEGYTLTELLYDSTNTVTTYSVSVIEPYKTLVLTELTSTVYDYYHNNIFSVVKAGNYYVMMRKVHNTNGQYELLITKIDTTSSSRVDYEISTISLQTPSGSTTNYDISSVKYAVILQTLEQNTDYYHLICVINDNILVFDTVRLTLNEFIPHNEAVFSVTGTITDITIDYKQSNNQYYIVVTSEDDSYKYLSVFTIEYDDFMMVYYISEWLTFKTTKDTEITFSADTMSVTAYRGDTIEVYNVLDGTAYRLTLDNNDYTLNYYGDDMFIIFNSTYSESIEIIDVKYSASKLILYKQLYASDSDNVMITVPTEYYILQTQLTDYALYSATITRGTNDINYQLVNTFMLSTSGYEIGFKYSPGDYTFTTEYFVNSVINNNIEFNNVIFEGNSILQRETNDASSEFDNLMSIQQIQSTTLFVTNSNIFNFEEMWTEYTYQQAQQYADTIKIIDLATGSTLFESP